MSARFASVQEQIEKLKQEEAEWDSKKIDYQTKIAKLKQEEQDWIIMKPILLAKLRTLRSAAAAPPDQRAEILKSFSIYSSNSKIQTTDPPAPNENPKRIEKEKEITTETENINHNDNSNEQETSNQIHNPSPAPSPVSKPKKAIKKRKGTAKKTDKPDFGDSTTEDSIISENSETIQFPYSLKWSLSQHLDCIRCAAFHSTLPYIATGSDDGTIRLTNLDPPKRPKAKKSSPVQLLSLRGHYGAVLSLAAHQNLLISGDVTGQICVWDFIETKSTLSDSHGRVDHHINYMNNDHNDAVWSIAAHSDVPYFISASADKTIRIHDFQTHTSEPISIEDCPSSVIFNSDGSMFIVGCTNGKIHIFSDKKEIEMMDINSRVISLCSGSSKDQIFVSCEDRNIHLVDLNSKEIIKSFIAHEGFTSAMILLPENDFLITTSSDKTIRVWKADTFDVVLADNYHREKYGEAGLSLASTPSTNSYKFFASGGADGMIKIFGKK